MDKSIEIIKLRDNLYLLDEAHEATGYLLIGEEKACLIDTMNGYNDLKKITSELTDKPIIVVNTHGHPDHIFGNVYFDKGYMAPVDIDIANAFLGDPECREWLEKNDLVFPPFEPVREGDVIELGGITLKVISIPGHTPGGILLLCPEERILFTGDSINHHLWMQLDHSLSIEDMVASVERILYLENEADYILHGHARNFDDISLISAMLGGLKELLEGKTEKDTPYKWFEGVSMYHPYDAPEGKRYSQDDHGICYEPKNIRRNGNLQ